VVLVEQTLNQGARIRKSSALVCPAQKIPQGLSTRRLRVRVPLGEPNELDFELLLPSG
jgi:hypothetical protein